MMKSRIIKAVGLSVLTGCLLLAPGAVLAQGTTAPKAKSAAAKQKPVDKVVVLPPLLTLIHGILVPAVIGTEYVVAADFSG